MLLLASRHFFSWLQSSPPFLIISPLYVFTCAGMHHSRRRNNYFCHACSASRVARRLPCKRDFLTDFSQHCARAQQAKQRHLTAGRNVRNELAKKIGSPCYLATLILIARRKEAASPLVTSFMERLLLLLLLLRWRLPARAAPS
jgi:hypothetical protein